MQTEAIELERSQAHKLWQKYQTHKHYQTPIDAEIERVYKAIARGKVVIKALDSIAKAGVGLDGFPKLALARADQSKCIVTMYYSGAARMAHEPWINGNTARSLYFDFPETTFPAGKRKRDRAEAIVPHIPPDIRPARGLANYHILFEAVWSKTPPYDPMLLRRVGKGDLWLVVGAWDLTEVERAAMASRVGVR